VVDDAADTTVDGSGVAGFAPARNQTSVERFPVSRFLSRLRFSVVAQFIRMLLVEKALGPNRTPRSYSN